MQAILAKHAGFCWGVKRAIDMAMEARQKANDTIYVLGHLVHNEEVVRKLEEYDIKIVKSFKEAKPGSVLLITAHGIDYKIIQEAKNAGYEIIDTTCPIVRNVHNFTRRFLDEGRKIIIIGHAEHIEVKGINGVADNKAQIIGKPEEIELLKLKVGDKPVPSFRSAGIVAQTTFNVSEKNRIIESLIEHFPDVDFKIKDTICNDVKKKQNEVRSLASEVDSIVVVGSRSSSNTTRLFEIASQYCPRTYFVSFASELKTIDWDGIECVGVVAGASTPGWIIQNVVECLKKS